MNKPNFTPGPWSVEFTKTRNWIGQLKENGKCDSIVVSISTDGFHDKAKEVADANAKLIAAAPDMYEALEACNEAMAYMSEYDIPLTLPDQVKAALAKARGELLERIYQEQRFNFSEELCNEIEAEMAKPVEPLYTHPPAQQKPLNWDASGTEYDRSIHSNPDATTWADLFLETFPNCGADRDTMVGWFANAIMAMYDWKDRQQKPLSDELYERLRTLERVCTGVTQDAIDGGWTAMGMMNYSNSLEKKLNPLTDDDKLKK